MAKKREDDLSSAEFLLDPIDSYALSMFFFISGNTNSRPSTFDRRKNMEQKHTSPHLNFIHENEGDLDFSLLNDLIAPDTVFHRFHLISTIVQELPAAA